MMQHEFGKIRQVQPIFAKAFAKVDIFFKATTHYHYFSWSDKKK